VDEGSWEGALAAKPEMTSLEKSVHRVPLRKG
jgi:hypothetical protein